MFTIKMTVNQFKPAAVIVGFTLIFVMLTSACNLDQAGNDGSGAVQSGGARAWLDQPGSDATLPLAPFRLKAHAALEGGGVSQIVFLANSIPLASVPTDASQDLVYAEWEWNPSAPGTYDIQVKAVTGSGEALSGVAHLCIASEMAAEGACAVAPQPAAEDITVTPTPVEGAITIDTSASPDPVYFGSCLEKEPQNLVIEAMPSDDANAADVLGRAWVEASNGSRDELPKQSMQKNAAGAYTTSFDLGGVSPKFMENKPGRVVYTVSLVDKNKEVYAASPEEFVDLLPCEATPTPVVEVKFKLGATPDPVYIGTCQNKEPQTMTVSGYLSDDSAVAEARVKVSIENAGGTRTPLFDQAMTKATDHYTASISVKDVDVKLLGAQAGRLIYQMSLVNDVDETYATSNEAAIGVLPCTYTPIPEQEEEAAPSQDTTSLTISGGGPSSGTIYYDPKGIDPKKCAPTSASFRVKVNDKSKVSSVVVYWYWASSGSGNVQSTPLSGTSGTYSFTFSPTKGDDKLFYYVIASDIYNNVAQSGTFSIAVITCKKRTIIKPLIIPTTILKPRVLPTIIVPTIK